MTVTSKGLWQRGDAVLDEAVVADVLSRASTGPVSFAEVYAERSFATTVTMEDAAVTDLNVQRRAGAGIRVMADGMTSYVHTDDLSPTGLLAAADQAVASLGDTAPPPPPTRGATAPVAGSLAAGLFTRLLGMDEAARDESPAVRGVTTRYDDIDQDVLIANTDGVVAHDHRRRTLIRITCVSSGPTGTQTGVEWLGRSQAADELFAEWDLERLARSASNAAARKQRARAIPHGVLPVVMAPGAGAVVIHEACGHGLEADLVQVGASVYAGRIGEQVASPLITVVDDATLPGEHGSFTVDDEGVPAQRTVLIERGVLRGYVWDASTGRATGQASTGNGRRQDYRHLPMVRMSNTVVLDGQDSPERILRETGTGLYVTGLGGGEVNTTTGNFAFGVTDGYLIENGELTHPVLPTSIIGNGPEVLAAIDAVGNDGRMWEGGGNCGKIQSAPIGLGQPTLRIPALTIGDR